MCDEKSPSWTERSQALIGLPVFSSRSFSQILLTSLILEVAMNFVKLFGTEHGIDVFHTLHINHNPVTFSLYFQNKAL